MDKVREWGVNLKPPTSLHLWIVRNPFTYLVRPVGIEPTSPGLHSGACTTSASVTWSQYEGSNLACRQYDSRLDPVLLAWRKVEELNPYPEDTRGFKPRCGPSRGTFHASQYEESNPAYLRTREALSQTLLAWYPHGDSNSVLKVENLRS